MLNKKHAPKEYEAVESSSCRGCGKCVFDYHGEICLAESHDLDKAECSAGERPDGHKGEFTKRASTWVTVISEYNGFISVRDVGPFDTTIYMDREIAVVPWLPGDEGPDHHAISEEMAKLGKKWLY